MAIQISELDISKAQANLEKKKSYTTDYYIKLHQHETLTILTIRINHEDKEMMEFYAWLMKHYPTKRRNGTVNMDAFIRAYKDKIMKEEE